MRTKSEMDKEIFQSVLVITLLIIILSMLAILFLSGCAWLRASASASASAKATAEMEQRIERVEDSINSVGSIVLNSDRIVSVVALLVAGGIGGIAVWKGVTR